METKPELPRVTDFYIQSLFKDVPPREINFTSKLCTLSSEKDLLIFTSLNFTNQFHNLSSWLRPGKKAYFLEKDPSKINFFLKNKSFQNILDHPQIDVLYWENENVIKQIAWMYLGKEVEIIGNNQLEEEEVNRIFIGVTMVAAEFQDFGVGTFRNVYQNINNTKIIKSGFDLFGKFKNIPAIICGAGPSLSDEIKVLKKMQNKALIFGGGSSLEPLCKNHISVDFGSTIDPDPSRRRFLNFTQFDTPFFIQFRMSHKIYKEIQGEKIWMGSSPGFILEELLYKMLNLPEILFDGGWVVSNYLSHVAYLLGCNPIIFVGMDHCWNKEELYAKDVSSNEERKGFEVKDMHGNQVITRADFYWANDWFSEFAQSHLETTFYNATSRGLAINGILHMPLSEIEKNLSQTDIDGIKHHAIETAKNLDLSKSGEFFREVIKSIQACMVICNNALKEIEKQFNSKVKIDPIEIIFPEIQNQLIYHACLKPMWEILKYPHLQNNPYPEVAQILMFNDILDTYLQIFVT